LARALEIINKTCPFDASGHPAMMLIGPTFDEAAVLRTSQAFETSGSWESM